MRTVELVPGIRSSVLGFGCAPILGSVDAKSARRALSLALDLGVSHLDLARSYGYGGAEGFVGKFLGTRRDKVTIATKFGIVATPSARMLAPVKPILRILKRFKRGSAGATEGSPKARIAERLIRRRPITAHEMRRSLETSLQALQTDRVEYLIIHEPTQTIPNIGEVIESAQHLKQEGKIRAFGLALMVSQWPLHDAYVKQFDLLQFNNSPGASHYAVMKKDRSESPNVLFSPFRSSPTSSLPATTNPLATIVSDFPRSVVLCSMFKPDHIRENVEAVGG